VQALRGRQVSIGECLSEGLKRLGPALGVAILAGIGIAVGMVLLVVPGLILATMWAAAVPVAVVEQLGVTASLSRSSELTRERRWRVFGAILVAGIISILVGGVIGGILGLFGGVSGVTGAFQAAPFAIVIWIVTAMTQAFSACVFATVYYFLRRDKEGIDIHQIASVFD
jgi:hypothetical protein